jgi:hypothetical protein
MAEAEGLVVLGSGSGDKSPRVDVHVGSTDGESFMDPHAEGVLKRMTLVAKQEESPNPPEAGVLHAQ